MVAVMSTAILGTMLLGPRRQLDITEEEEQTIHELLRLSGSMSADQVASVLRLDEAEVAVYLANQAGLGYVNHQAGEYAAWHWL